MGDFCSGKASSRKIFINPDEKSLKTQIYGHHSYPDYRFGRGP
jgi:hypothetical protein